MTWTLARCLRAAFDEANRAYPARSKVSDGTIGDKAHASRTSDHNPCSCHRFVHAGDFTNDPAVGFDVHAWLRSLAAHGDGRVKYLISNGQIWNPGSEAWNTYTRLRAEGHSRREAARMALPGWRTYSGSNPHVAHGHISVKHTDQARGDASSWFYSDITVHSPTPWKWSEHMPGPLEFTSALDCPTGGYWKQTAEGGIYAHGGAPYLGAYNAHPELGGNVRYFTALIASGRGGYVQVANDGAVYDWSPK